MRLRAQPCKHTHLQTLVNRPSPQLTLQTQAQVNRPSLQLTSRPQTSSQTPWPEINLQLEHKKANLTILCSTPILIPTLSNNVLVIKLWTTRKLSRSSATGTTTSRPRLVVRKTDYLTQQCLSMPQLSKDSTSRCKPQDILCSQTYL